MLRFQRLLSPCVSFVSMAITHAFRYDVAEHREERA